MSGFPPDPAMSTRRLQRRIVSDQDEGACALGRVRVCRRFTMIRFMCLSHPVDCLHP
jgi:hypothetical protein